ncbi:MAG: replication endonuclease [Sulfurospirillum sp.]
MFGLTKNMRQLALDKIEKNKLFLDNNFLVVDDKHIPLSDITKNSYINSNRYIAEINNRVNSLYSYAKSRDLQNIFLTLTLPSIYHPKKTLSSGKVINNKNYNGREFLFTCKHPITKKKIKFINPMSNRKKYFPKEASKQLSKMFSRLLTHRSWCKIPKSDRVYFRVIEPHKDGCPHLHISIFIPKQYVDNIVKVIKRFYPFPLGKLEVNIKNPVAYLMKYILKTLDDLRYGDDKITDLTLWYILHGICRIYTSRTLVSLDVYRALKGRYTLNELTWMYRDKEISVFVDPNTNKLLEIVDKYGTLWSKKSFKVTSSINYDNRKPVLKEKKSSRIPVFIVKNGISFDISKPVLSYKDYQLFEYYKNLDLEYCNLQHYGLVQNELIERGLLDMDYIPPNYFNMDFDYAS